MMVDELFEELKRRGVVLYVGSCGCCGSPWIQAELDGKMVVDSEGESMGEGSYFMGRKVEE